LVKDVFTNTQLWIDVFRGMLYTNALTYDCRAHTCIGKRVASWKIQRLGRGSKQRQKVKKIKEHIYTLMICSDLYFTVVTFWWFVKMIFRF